MFFLTEIFVKIISQILKKFFKTGGETWPGELVLKLNPKIHKDLKNIFRQVIIILGTNGKTSTAKLITEVLTKSGKKVIYNPSGANQLNGIVSNILLQKKILVDKDYYGVFEVDEYSFAQICRFLPPSYVIILNLVRDQLDRFGEVQNILNKWKSVLEKSDKTKIIANAADPGIYFMLKNFPKEQVVFYSIQEKFLHQEPSVLGDVVYCPNCQAKLNYKGYYVSHLGRFSCENCRTFPRVDFVFSNSEIQQFSNLSSYNLINSQAVYILSKELNLKESVFWEALNNWTPAFGRGEKFKKNGKTYHFFLGKNPSSWTVAMEEMIKENSKFKNQNSKVKFKIQNNSSLEVNGNLTTIFVFGLNNRIPDGHDVSWIWDVNISSNVKCQMLKKIPNPNIQQNFKSDISSDKAAFDAAQTINDKSRLTRTLTTNYSLLTTIYVFGDRCYDLALRFENDGIKVAKVFEKPKELLQELEKQNENNIYILANYSAMLEIRKLITGRAIL